MTFIEVNVMKKVGFLAVESIVAVLPNVNTKTGCVVYMEEPVNAVEIDQSPEEVYELIYETTESPEEDEEHDEEPDLEAMVEAYEQMMLNAWEPEEGHEQ